MCGWVENSGLVAVHCTSESGLLGFYPRVPPLSIGCGLYTSLPIFSGEGEASVASASGSIPSLSALYYAKVTHARVLCL